MAANFGRPCFHFKCYLCGLLLRDGGGLEVCDRGLVRDVEPVSREPPIEEPVRLPEDPESLLPEVVGAVLTGALDSVGTVTGRVPLSASFAPRSRWRTDPRGTPKLAEPGSMASGVGGLAGLAASPRPTITS